MKPELRTEHPAVVGIEVNLCSHASVAGSLDSSQSDWFPTIWNRLTGQIPQADILDVALSPKAGLS
jgi:hypothetical protein